MDIYLDIDGTLIHEDTFETKAAEGLEEFIVALRPHTTYWLTTHCRNGNPTRPREILKQYLPTSLHSEIDRIKGTVWDTMKTQGIDWSRDFIWFDNDIRQAEWEIMKQGNPNQQVIEINLKANPDQLVEIAHEISI